MSDKCKWKNGKFEGCCAMQARLSYKYKIKKAQNMDITTVISGGDIFIFCPFCGADIRKPEPEKQDPDNWSKEKWIAFYHAVKPFMGIDNND